MNNHRILQLLKRAYFLKLFLKNFTMNNYLNIKLPRYIAIDLVFLPLFHTKIMSTDNGVEKHIKVRLDSIRQAIADASRYDK